MTDAIQIETDRSNNSRYAGGTIYTGLPVEEVTNGGQLEYVKMDATSASYDGTAVQPQSGDWVQEHPTDTRSTTYDAPAYETSDSDDLNDTDRVPVNGFSDGDKVKMRTLLDGAAPDISDGDVVGVIDTSDSNANDSAYGIAQEGYSDDDDGDTTSTTFNTSNDNFIPLGKARGDSSKNLDLVTVEIRRDDL